MASGTLRQILVSAAFLSFAAASIAASSPQSARVHYQRGNELARTGKFEQALAELNRAAELDPQSPHIQNLLGVILAKLGRLEEADVAYTRALALDSNFEPARKNRALSAYSRGQYEFAAQEFAALAKLRPRDAVPRLFLGLDALRRSDFPVARAHLIEARRLAPENAQALLALTRTYFALGEREQALESSAAFRKLKASSNERFEMAALLELFGAHNEAAQLFAELRKEQPGSYAVAFNLALSLYRAGRMGEALKVTDQLLADATPPGELLNLHGRILNRLGRFAEAREWFRRAIEAEPMNSGHYLDLSTVLSNVGEAEEAESVVNEGLERGAERAPLLVQLGLLYQRRDRRVEAERLFREAIATAPQRGSGYLALASLQAASGRRHEALSTLERAVASLPSNPYLLCFYAGLLFEKSEEIRPGDLDQAVESLRRALEVNPFYARAHYLLGKLYFRRGEFEPARKHLEKSLAFDPGQINAYYQLSLIARQQGDRAKAAELSRTYQKLTRESNAGFEESIAEAARDGLDTERQPGLRMTDKP